MVKYDLIYTDPPWQVQKTLRKIRPNQHKELNYPTLPLADIKAIHEDKFKLLADKHNVFMWTTDKYLRSAEDLMSELGYMIHARLIWDKGNGIAAAFTVRFSHEYLIWFFKRGGYIIPPVI